MKKKDLTNLSDKELQVLSDLSKKLGYDYEEEIATYDQTRKEWVKTTVKKHRPADILEMERWLAIRPKQWSSLKKWWQFWKK